MEAYLKLSVSITGESDTPVELVADKGDESGQTKAIMPACIQPKYRQLKLHILRGENLPKLDTRLLRESKMDAYLKTSIGPKVLKTAIRTTVGDQCTWNQTFLIPI